MFINRDPFHGTWKSCLLTRALPPPHFCHLSWIPTGLFNTSIKYHPLHFLSECLCIHWDPSLDYSILCLGSCPPPLPPPPASGPCTLHSVSAYLSPCDYTFTYLSLSLDSEPLGVCTCVFPHVSCFPGLWEDRCHELASLTDSTYVPEDSVGGLHASMNVVRYMAMQQPCPWVISKQLNGLKCSRKEIIHIFSVEIIYLQTSKDRLVASFVQHGKKKKKSEETQ